MFEFKSYRDCIKNGLIRQSLSMRWLAEHARIHPSYLSRVMTGKADLSQEQLYRIAQCLNFNASERHYLLLLGQRDTCHDHGYRTHLEQQIAQFREEWQRLGKKLLSGGMMEWDDDRKIREYYRRPLTAKVHMLLTIDRYRANPELIAKDLHLTRAILQNELARLETLGLIKTGENGWHVTEEHLHLDSQHECSVQNLVNWRLDAIEQLNRKKFDPRDYHFSAAFTANPAIKSEFIRRLKEVLVEFKESVNTAEQTELYQLNIDLY